MARGKFEYWRTEDGLALLKGYARRGLTDEQIANDKLHISRSTLSEWKKKFPDISDALKEGKDLPDVQVENALYLAAVEDRNVTAIIFYLKNRLPNYYRDHPEEGNTSPEEVKVIIDV